MRISKRTISAFALACLLALVICSPISAQIPDGPPGDPPNRVFGQVTAVGSSSITVKSRGGELKEIIVTAETQYFRNRAPATLSSFQVNDHLVARGAPGAGGQFVAERVMGGDTLPRGPRHRRPFHTIVGEISAINAAEGAITVKGREGEAQVIYTKAATEFRRDRQEATLGDFKIGDHVAASGQLDAEGKFIADRLVGGEARPRGPARIRLNQLTGDTTQTARTLRLRRSFEWDRL